MSYEITMKQMKTDEYGVLDGYIFKVTDTIATKRLTIIEERIKMVLQPKPSWMPQFVWTYLLRRLIRQEIYDLVRHPVTGKDNV
jgi:hypothetical protein